ncbi:MAG TPA: Uma2 family endonuclease [Gemmatimonadales bacterium]|nr:Uma2 family endonuclease [Gemmatimonadales bacterium]
MPAPAYYTRDMLRDIPEDGNRYELVRGELLVTPAPRPWHEIVTRRLDAALVAFVSRAQPHLFVFGSRSEVSWGDNDTEVQPDMFVVPLTDARAMAWDRLRDLRLVVEVLSPSTARHDRFTKRLEYQRRGVPLYWIVDPEERVVEIWTPDDHLPRFERERLVWSPAGAEAVFTMALADLFRPL